MEEKLTCQEATKFQKFRQTAVWEYLQVIVEISISACVGGMISLFIVFVALVVR